MSSTGISGRAVQAGLLVFGIPFIVAIGALAFRSELPPYVAANATVISIVAGVGALGAVLTVLLSWLADRRTISRLNDTIKEMQTALTLKDSELAAKTEQHALELTMKQQQLDQQRELLAQEAKISDLKNELTIRGLRLEALQAQQPAPESLVGESKREKVGARKDPIRTTSASEEAAASPETVKTPQRS